MPNTFDEILFDVYPNSPGGQVQAQAKANQLAAIGYRTSFNTVTDNVLWQNHVDNDKTDMATHSTGVVVLTAVKP